MLPTLRTRTTGARRATSPSAILAFFKLDIPSGEARKSFPPHLADANDGGAARHQPVGEGAGGGGAYRHDRPRQQRQERRRPQVQPQHLPRKQVRVQGVGCASSAVQPQHLLPAQVTVCSRRGQGVGFWLPRVSPGLIGATGV